MTSEGLRACPDPAVAGEGMTPVSKSQNGRWRGQIGILLAPAKIFASRGARSVLFPEAAGSRSMGPKREANHETRQSTHQGGHRTYRGGDGGAMGDETLDGARGRAAHRRRELPRKLASARPQHRLEPRDLPRRIRPQG